MSLSKDILTKCFGIEQYEVSKIINDEVEKRIILEIERPGPCYCGKCGTVSGRYDSSWQEFLIGSLNAQAVYARTKIYRVRCPFHEVVTEKHGLSDGKRRYSKAMGKLVVHFTKELDNEAACRLLGFSPTTLYRIDCEELSGMQRQYLEDLPMLKHLGVDEIAYKRRHNYATVISDYDGSNVIWLEPERTSASLETGYSIIANALEKVDLVSMDFWRAFEKATRAKLPQAKIVYDRFHLSRLLNRAVETERRNYQNSLSIEDRRFIKRDTRWLLLKRQFNLTEKNQSHLEKLKTTNERLYEMYLLKESFLAIFNQEATVSMARKLIFSWIRDIFQLDFEALKRFAKSILKRIRNILYWFKKPISNAKAEGINNVIRTLLKRGYGYKNFSYFRMKVLQKCGLLMNYATHTF
jgi:transposase